MAAMADAGRWQMQKNSLGHTSLFLILSLIVFLQVSLVSSSSLLFSFLSSLPTSDTNKQSGLLTI